MGCRAELMRWFWIDRFTEFVSGQRATAKKNVALCEEQLADHFPGYPMMPHSLIVEGLAQTGGLLVNESSDFKERVVLAKLSNGTFHFPALPGDTLIYRATVEQINQDGAIVTATSHINDQLQGEAKIVFAHLSDRDEVGEMFEPLELLTWLKVLGIFDIGVRPDGSRIEIPPHLAKAELTG